MAMNWNAIQNIGEIKGTIKKFSATIDPPSVAATSVAAVDVTVSGVKSGDIVLAYNLANYSTLSGVGICGAFVTDDDTITILLVNPTGSAIDPSETTWTFYILRPAGVE